MPCGLGPIKGMSTSPTLWIRVWLLYLLISTTWAHIIPTFDKCSNCFVNRNAFATAKSPSRHTACIQNGRYTQKHDKYVRETRTVSSATRRFRLTKQRIGWDIKITNPRVQYKKLTLTTVASFRFLFFFFCYFLKFFPAHYYRVCTFKTSNVFSV